MTSSLLLGKARPNLWRQDPRIRNYFDILERILRDVDTSTSEASSSDVVSALTAQIASLERLVADLQNRLDSIPALVPDYNPVVTSVDYVAVDFDFVNAKSNCKVTFPQYPTVNSVVIIRNGDGSIIKLDGNGKNINGSLTGKLRKEGTAYVFQYFIDSDEWFSR